MDQVEDKKRSFRTTLSLLPLAARSLPIMKRTSLSFLLSLPAAAGLVCIVASIAAAQAPGRDGGGGRGPGPGGRFGGRMLPSPVVQALDTDGDGELSAKEIENATAALKTLDKDKDGKLSTDELRPSIAGRGPGQGSGEAQAFVAQLLTFDKNGDGKLAKDELPERMQILMDRADANRDGFVDKAELTTFAERAARRNPGDAAPGPGGGGEPRRRARPQAPPANPAE
jgi:hypothetical protein